MVIQARSGAQRTEVALPRRSANLFNLNHSLVHSPKTNFSRTLSPSLYATVSWICFDHVSVIILKL